MEKSFWGPSTWCMIHNAAASYNPEHIISFKQFIYSLQYLLPCEYCRNHLMNNLTILPIGYEELSSNEKLFLWSFKLHDLVNKQLGKTTPYSYEFIKNYYFKNSKNNKFWGPCFWRAIHSFAASYRPDPLVKNAFKQFIYSLINIIPCEKSKHKYRENITLKLPLLDEYFENAHQLFLWTFLLHDLTNKQLGKNTPSFEQIKSQYFNERVCKSCGI
jgi:hypothetical protein